MTWTASLLPDDALDPTSLVGTMLNADKVQPEAMAAAMEFMDAYDSDLRAMADRERAERAATVNPMPRLPSDKDLDDWISECAELTRSGKRGHYWAFEVGADDVRDIVRAALARWA